MFSSEELGTGRVISHGMVSYRGSSFRSRWSGRVEKVRFGGKVSEINL